ncbi:MAG TPA: RNA 2',3'-cyclic phosphodiesterase [Burkholderiales bacterium]|nr:RNA 2',3'-cyclic phosphodiesterase [Burkholderiales bacterium]
MSAAPAERARVFFALWPDTSVRDALAAVAADAQVECGGRVTARDKIHLTLFFVGDIERSRVQALEECAGAVEAGRFELDTGVLGYWRHNRIVWAGASACPTELAKLVSSLTQKLARVGRRGDDRPYVPHVTLLRNARRAPKRTIIEVPVWNAHEFVLVESARGPGKSGYEVIARWPLAARP